MDRARGAFLHMHLPWMLCVNLNTLNLEALPARAAQRSEPHHSALLGILPVFLHQGHHVYCLLCTTKSLRALILLACDYVRLLLLAVGHLATRTHHALPYQVV